MWSAIRQRKERRIFQRSVDMGARLQVNVESILESIRGANRYTAEN